MKAGIEAGIKSGIVAGIEAGIKAGIKAGSSNKQINVLDSLTEYRFTKKENQSNPRWQSLSGSNADKAYIYNDNIIDQNQEKNLISSFHERYGKQKGNKLFEHLKVAYKNINNLNVKNANCIDNEIEKERKNEERSKCKEGNELLVDKDKNEESQENSPSWNRIRDFFDYMKNDPKENYVIGGHSFWFKKFMQFAY